MKILAFDTETTGIARGADYTHPDNPHLAAITGILYDTEAKRVEQSINMAIRPDGWVMPAEAGAVNGLTTEYLNDNGILLNSVLPLFIKLAFLSDLLVAHNVAFDKKIISSALWRYGISEGEEETYIHDLILEWQNHPHYCTMESAKPIVKALNKAGRLKYPKLSETYEHFFKRPLDNAHSANADTIAVLEIYTALTNGE